jgi:hypothetical protein
MSRFIWIAAIALPFIAVLTFLVLGTLPATNEPQAPFYNENTSRTPGVAQRPLP